MYLNLAHRRFFDGKGGHALSAPEAGDSFYRSAAVKTVMERLERSPGQRVLALGVLNGEAVSTLGGKGARVHVHDLVTPRRAQSGKGGAGIVERLARLPIAPGSLHAVLAWELFELLSTQDARRAMGILRDWLAPRALILAVFHTSPVDRVHRYRLDADSGVRIDVAAQLSTPVQPFTNSDAVGLFSGLTLLHSALLRQGVREVLAQQPAA